MADANPDVATFSAGWLIVVGIAVGGWLLRVLLGRQLAAYDEERKEVREFMVSINKRLGKLEGRFTQQDADAGSE